jgi:hypothetical protein
MLVRPIGEGGMGRVWLAHQIDPPRSVAIKFLHFGLFWLNPERLLVEAKALARLAHEGIARLYGVERLPESGEPFLVMEYVEGEPLLTWAQGRSTREKIELLVKLCEALEHAHQRGVIHRDLKPENILVTAEDKAKILDFGIARLQATEEDREQPAKLTHAGFVVGTLRYMSPEQTFSDRDDLDTRSDLYSLALIGYELLTGRLPYELPSDQVSAITVIREAHPRRLAVFDRRLKGDLEAIFAKALEKNRERRYPSARAFADDLRRYLEARPVLARPPTLLYRTARFLRRNPLLSALVLLAAVGVLGGAIGMLLFAQRESAARQLAERESARARASLAILQRAIIEGNPYETAQRERTIGDLLTDLVSELESEQGLESDSRFDLLLMLADVRRMRGEYELQQRALEQAKTLAGADAGRNLRVAVREALGEVAQGRLEEAYARLATALPALAELSPSDPVLIPARIAAAETAADLGKTAEASEWLEIPPQHPLAPHEILGLHRARARLAFRGGDAARALSEAGEALRFAEERFGGGHLVTASALVEVGFYAAERGDLVRAEAAYREALALFEERLGAEHPKNLSLLDNLAGLLIDVGRVKEAEGFLRRIEAVLDRLPGDHEQHFWLAHRRAYLAALRGDFRGAAEERRRALALAERIFGREAEPTVAEMFNLAIALERLGEMEEALNLIAEARERAIAAYPPLHPLILRSEREWVAALRVRERLEEAAAHLTGVLAEAVAKLPPDHAERLKLEAEALELAYERNEDQTLIERLPETLARASRLWGETDAVVLRLRLLAALVRLRRGEGEAGAEELERLFAESEGLGLVSFAAKIANSAANAYEALGDVAGAEHWRRRGEAIASQAEGQQGP